MSNNGGQRNLIVEQLDNTINTAEGEQAPDLPDVFVEFG